MAASEAVHYLFSLYLCSFAVFKDGWAFGNTKSYIIILLNHRAIGTRKLFNLRSPNPPWFTAQKKWLNHVLMIFFRMKNCLKKGMSINTDLVRVRNILSMKNNRIYLYSWNYLIAKKWIMLYIVQKILCSNLGRNVASYLIPWDLSSFRVLQLPPTFRSSKVYSGLK